MTATLTINESDRLEVAFKYDPAMVEQVRGLDPRRQYHPETKTWSFPAEPHIAKELCGLFGLDTFHLPENVAKLALVDPRRPRLDRASMDMARNFSWRIEPYGHQMVALAELIQNERWLLAHDMGCGKTAVVAARIRLGLDRDEFTGPILVVCPKSVVSVWPAELEKHAGLRCRVIGTKDRKQLDFHIKLGNKWQIIVLNYELARVERDFLTGCGFDVVVCDESHRLKHLTTQTYRAVRKISRSARYRWALTGTPAPNGPLDVHGILTFLDGAHTAGTESVVAFRARYAVMGGWEHRQVVGYKNMDDLEQRVASISSRVTKADALDLPPKVFLKRACYLAGEQKRVYTELRKQAVAKLHQDKQESRLTATNVLVEALRLLQVAGGFVPDDAGRMHSLNPNSKMALLVDVLADLDGEQVIIWASFLEEIRAIVVRLHELYGYSGEVPNENMVSVLTGATPADLRAEGVARFQAGKARFFVGTPQAGGEGITLTAASTAIYYSRTFNAGHYWQSSDRNHRIGQHRPVAIINLIADGTVDERVDNALDRKLSLQELVLSGAKPEELL